MKKKGISLILALAMLATSVISVFAAETPITVSGTGLTKMVTFFADNVPYDENSTADLEQRKELLGYIQMYLGTGDTDRNIQTMIAAVKEKSFAGMNLPAGSPADLETIFNNLIKDDEIYSATLFALELIHAIPADKRDEVIKGFGVKDTDGTRTSYEIADTDNAAAIKAALTGLYNNNSVYPERLRKAMEEHEALDATVAPYVILNLFTAWKDCFQFTDDSTTADDFAVLSVGDEYAERLLTNMQGSYTLNGAAITDAKQVVKTVADALNAAYNQATKAQMKTVLNDSNLDLYVPETEITTDLKGLTINGEPVTPSADESAPTPVTVVGDTFTIVGTPEAGGATVEYAVVEDGKEPADWAWAGTMQQNIDPGDTINVAVRVINGDFAAIYYLAVSRQMVDSDVALDSITTSANMAVTFDPQVKDYTVSVAGGEDPYTIEGVINAGSPADGAVISYATGNIGDDVTELTYAEKTTEAPAASVTVAKGDSALIAVKVENNGRIQYYTFNLYALTTAILDIETEGFELSREFAPDRYNYAMETVTSDDGTFAIILTDYADGATVTYGISEDVSLASEEYDEVAVTAYNGEIAGELDYGEQAMVVIKLTAGEDTSYYTFKLEREEEEPEPTKTPSRRPSSDDDDKSSSNRHNGIIIPTEDEGIPAPPATTYLFPDTVDHWAKDYIGAVASYNVVQGYDDGNFLPNASVTRQEMAVMLVRMLGIENELGSAPAVSYTDSASIALWAYDSVALLSAKGIYTGYDDGEFKPTRTISREEIISLMMRLYGETDADTVIRYSDAEQVAQWALTYVGQGTNLGIINGHETGLFRPKADVTRAEACKIIYNYNYLKTSGQ